MVATIHQLDTCGLSCPMPLLKAKQALNRMNSGEQLQVSATDQGSWRDFQVFAEQSGHLLLDRQLDNGIYRYLLQKNNFYSCCRSGSAN
ncbi:sulfurtransferase TusA family protein [Oceanicoccus sp. KOV_DT_Chl]|uniref:sulfurtransferase TusA family protein n=1 Tax=Oceanicoccus sp. KOV_DT_Chl TaxID=1904639 RepID=UPI000C7AF850|nr:sulfurtransferase TusA family protein [Oceanicoccus sp. KOV_DT_Chl]